MRNASLTIGSVPFDEPCAQVGDPNYWEAAKSECAAFRNQIRRVLGAEPEGAAIVIRRHEHEFGSYFEVEVDFDDRIPAAVDYAFNAEGSEKLRRWDKQARAELKAHNYSIIPLTSTTGAS